MSIRVFNVSEHLKLADDESDTLTHHIIGTNMDDLTQIYNGHVIIRGSATFDNAFVSSTSDNLFMQPIHNSNKESTPKMNEAIVQVNGVLFRLPHVAHEFWMKSVDQVLQTATITHTHPIFMFFYTLISICSTLVISNSLKPLQHQDYPQIA